MLGDDDLSAVFFGPDFAQSWTRLADGQNAPVQFAAIRGVEDVEGLQGYTLSADHELTYITSDVDLHEGQTLQLERSAALWRVRGEPKRAADGATSTVLIGASPT